MGNTLYFLRHAETKKNASLPVSRWALTDDGRKKAEALAGTGIFDDADAIISSSEEKAYQTAKPFAERTGKPVIRNPGLNEIDRDKGGMLGKEEYESMKAKIFEDFDFTDHGWETSGHALGRFRAAAEEIDRLYENKKILIVAHGTVMSLYFAYLQNKLDDIFPRWKKLGFLGWGIVHNGKVVKDVSDATCNVSK